MKRKYTPKTAMMNAKTAVRTITKQKRPQAGWLYRNLHEKVNKLVVSEPRRNKLISSEGDRDDKIDSDKLTVLLRGNFLKAVHHTCDKPTNISNNTIGSVYWIDLKNHLTQGLKNSAETQVE